MTRTTAPIRHILVPHDFSETADRALALALDLAKKLGARVTLSHIYQVVTYAYAENIALTADMIRELDRSARAALENIAKRARDQGIEVATDVRQGLPWMEIVALAEEVKPDLIVMGTHGRKGFSRMFLGSVAEQILRSAPCPVLTVRGSDVAK